MVYAELWKRDAERKEKREKDEIEARRKEQAERNDILNWQKNELDRRRQEQKNLADREKEMLVRNRGNGIDKYDN